METAHFIKLEFLIEKLFVRRKWVFFIKVSSKSFDFILPERKQRNIVSRFIKW